jgi:hypothetical protein
MGRKFNFFSDVINPLKKDVIRPLAKSLSPVAKPIIGALTQQATNKIQSLKTGGKAKPGLAILHKNEYVLPANAKPTKAQKAVVAKNKKKEKK